MNAHDGNSLLQTAEGALSEVHTMLNRLSDLAGQAANGTLAQSQRDSIQQEAGDILKEINRISKATNFNGINLLDGSLNGSRPVQTQGTAVSETAAVAGQYAYQNVGSVQNLRAGDTVSVNLGLNNQDSFAATFTVSDDLTSLVSSDGTTIALGAASTNDGTSLALDGADFVSAIEGALRKTGAATPFTIEANGNNFVLQNRESGTKAPQITELSYKVNDNAYQSVGTVAVNAPSDAQQYIDKSRLTVFNGQNESAATFSVNGQKFALVQNATYSETVTKLADRGITAIGVDGASGAALSGDDLSRIAADINKNTGLALQADAAGGRIMLKDSGKGEGLVLQVGDTAADYNKVNVQVGNMSSSGLGIAGIDLSSQEGAARALERIGSAIDKVSTARGNLGATQNRLDHTISSLEVTNENITAAESRIRDVDMAKMMMEFVKSNVLSQSAQAMMAHSNMQAQQVLQLLR